MTRHRLNFIKAALLKARSANKGSRDSYYDKREAGHILAVTGAGSKSFYLCKRIEARPERLSLGKFPDMTVEQVRKAAANAKGGIAVGANPQKEKRAIRDEMTFAALFGFFTGERFGVTDDTVVCCMA
ncbi:Arm DNA-binding domain-containing protein [Ruegeria sp. Alg231-54]|uniref:Arm DNA-binding domain-containing protein n=1 Tax=Ruegeria sp. Alg231-54 TaxID=1922221 RepID=UPI000D55195A|nr:Arm DNA-binding domain-containing protein [Ruegeria sp. Alg231-54]